MLNLKSLSVLFSGMLILFSSAGCFSLGYKIKGERLAPVTLPTTGQKLSVRNIEIEVTGFAQSARALGDSFSTMMTAQRLNKILAAEHPNSFSEQGSLPIDLAVSVEFPEPKMGLKEFSCFFVSLCSLTIIPMMGEGTFDINVDVVSGTGVKKTVLQRSRQATVVGMTSWWSFWPIGWIPCPLPTDTPKEAGTISSTWKFSEPSKNFINREVAQRVAKTISEGNFEEIKRAALLRSLE